jgi:hypothetical protein
LLPIKTFLEAIVTEPVIADFVPGDLPARHTYSYLVAFKQIHTTFDHAAHVLIKDLAYWNSADRDSSMEKGAMFAWGLHQSCIQNAALWGTEFLGSGAAHSKAMAGLVSTMQTPDAHVSDIAKGLSNLFKFSS